jgi:hypothetical protein
MNFQAAVKGIAPAGGIRPASHITASFVSATKAKPAAHIFVGQRNNIAWARGMGRIIRFASRRSREEAWCRVWNNSSAFFASLRNFGNPCAEKVSAHRSRQIPFV